MSYISLEEKQINACQIILNYFKCDVQVCSVQWLLSLNASLIRFPSLRMIQEVTKRTPCFRPAAFPPQRPARRTWSTTRTFGRSRNPKWGGRNETDMNQQTHLPQWLALSAVQWFPPERREARRWSVRDQRRCWFFCILTDFFWRDNFFFFVLRYFSASTNLVKTWCNIPPLQKSVILWIKIN